jgi:cellulose synthase/poly-beta-1,6-N-acetylglucosamine synthase-like glycosyltransferase
MTKDNPYVSIIVPFYGKSDSQLLKCINALNSQSYPSDKFEIIIVDNNIRQLFFSKSISSVTIRVYHEIRPGSYAARNKGISVAKGAILAFTDSDCIPEKKWLEVAIKGLINLNYANPIGGAISFFYKKEGHPNIFEQIDSTIHLRQEEYIADLNYAATANFILDSNFFKKVGGFDSEYYAGGDREWGNRLMCIGKKIQYCPEAIVFHPARSSFWELAEKNRRAVGGEIIHMRKIKLKSHIFTLQIANYRKRKKLIDYSKYINPRNINKAKIILFFIYVVRYLESVRLYFGGKCKR